MLKHTPLPPTALTYVHIYTHTFICFGVPVNHWRPITRRALWNEFAFQFGPVSPNVYNSVTTFQKGLRCCFWWSLISKFLCSSVFTLIFSFLFSFSIIKEVGLERSNALGFVRQFGISPAKNTSQFPGMSHQQFSRSLEPGQMGFPRGVGPLPFLAHTIETWNWRFLWPHICFKKILFSPSGEFKPEIEHCFSRERSRRNADEVGVKYHIFIQVL